MRSNRALLIVLILLLTGGAAAALYWTFTSADNHPQRPSQTAELSDPAPQASPTPGPDAGPTTVPTRDAATQTGTSRPEPRPQQDPVIKAVDAPELAESIRRRAMPEIQNPLNTSAEFSATIFGRVTDSTGAGIEGATVQAGGMLDGRANLGAMGRARAPRFAYTATTDALGNYEVQLKVNLPSSADAVQVQLSAKAPGFVSGEPLLLDGVRNAEERRGADISLQPAAVVRGKVFDATGTPLAAVTIVATRQQAEGPGQRRIRDGSGSRFAVQTDENGEWKLDTLSAGEWQFMATSAEHELPADQRFKLALTEGVEAVAPDMVLQRSTTIRARLLLQDGSPLNGENVRATAVLRLSTGQVATSSGMVDEEGYVVFTRVPQESQELTVRVNGYEPGDPIVVSPMPHSEFDAGAVYLRPRAQEE